MINFPQTTLVFFVLSNLNLKDFRVPGRRRIDKTESLVEGIEEKTVDTLNLLTMEYKILMYIPWNVSWTFYHT